MTDRLKHAPGTPQHFWAGMKKHFGIFGGGKYTDTACLMCGKVAKLDVVKFDDWLHEKHGNYEDAWGLSMSEFVEKTYGKDAEQFLRSLL